MKEYIKKKKELKLYTDKTRESEREYAKKKQKEPKKNAERKEWEIIKL